MGKHSPAKGKRLEQQVTRMLRNAGLDAQRVPRSGQAGGRFANDVRFTAPGFGDLSVECKAQADGFKQLYGWLEDADTLVVKADRQEPLLVLPLGLVIALISGGKP